ncbi:hypothetical protein QP178_19615 [Sphingomonas aurantiaca]
MATAKLQIIPTSFPVHDAKLTDFASAQKQQETEGFSDAKY